MVISMQHFGAVGAGLVLAWAGCARPLDAPAAATAPAAARSADNVRLEVSYQRRGQRTLVRIRPSRRLAAGETQLLAGATIERRADRPPAALLIGVRSATKRWRHAGCRSMDIRAGGALLHRTRVQRETEIGAGVLAEYLYGSIPFAVAQQLAALSQFTISLCEHTFIPHGDELATMRALVRRLTPRPRAVLGDGSNL